MKNLKKFYENQINNAKNENDIKSIVIEISQDCSAYKIGWDEFIDLRKKSKNKGLELGSKWSELL